MADDLKDEGPPWSGDYEHLDEKPDPPLLGAYDDLVRTLGVLLGSSLAGVVIIAIAARCST